MDTVSLIGLLIAPITGIVSWIAGTRSRRNSIYKELMSTIATLTEQNARYNQSIVELQNEVIEVRRENAELKAGQEVMTMKLSELQKENSELRAIVVRGKKIPVPKKQTKS